MGFHRARHLWKCTLASQGSVVHEQLGICKIVQLASSFSLIILVILSVVFSLTLSGTHAIAEISPGKSVSLQNFSPKTQQGADNVSQISYQNY